MSKMQRMIIMALVAMLAAGGSSALARGKKNRSNEQTGTNATTEARTQDVGKQRHHVPHGIVTAVGASSITIEKEKKHKTKTFKLAAQVEVDKQGHDKKHGKKGAEQMASGSKGSLSEVKVGDHVKLTLAGEKKHKEVVKILDKGEHHKHAKGGMRNQGSGQST